MLAVFRCDASHSLGGGHLMRCRTLAKRLSEAGWDTVTVTAEGSRLQTFSDTSEPHAIVEFPLKVANHPRTLRKFFPDGCDLLVVDHYELDQRYESACRDWAAQILVIDDLANRSHNCDWLLDATPGRDPNDYKKLTSPDCRMLVGGNYALLRKDFLTLRNATISGRMEKKGEFAKRIFLSFGLTDPAGATMVALQGLAGLDPTILIEVVLSSDSPVFSQVVVLAQHLGPRVAVVGPVKDMARRMSRADLAIGGCGITALERCCLGLPSVTVTLAQNQEMIAQALQRSGATIHLGKHGNVNSAEYTRAIENAIRDEDFLRCMSRAAAGFCDGHGATRTALAVTPPEGSSFGAVGLRLANASDVWQVYQWQCQPMTRRFAYNPEIPSRAEHQKWFTASLDNPDRVLAIIESDGRPVGVLRLDPVKNSPAKEVSIYIAPDQYRKGIAKAALGFAAKFWPYQDFVARVKHENVASHRLFTSAGYMPIGEDTYLLAADNDNRSR